MKKVQGRISMSFKNRALRSTEHRPASRIYVCRVGGTKHMSVALFQMFKNTPFEGLPFVESQKQQDSILSISTLLAFPIIALRSTIMNNLSFTIILFKKFNF